MSLGTVQTRGNDYNYAGFDGGFLAASDNNDCPGVSDTTSLTWANIDISGYTDLEFSGLFATALPDFVFKPWMAR